MALSSASSDGIKKSGEMSWYYVQPGFKLIGLKGILGGIILFVFILFLIGRISHSLIFDSPWALVVVPVVALIVIWFVMAMQPHRQVYYRIDREGVYCEFRSSASPLAGCVDLFFNMLWSLLRIKNIFYFNKHSSRTRMFEWREVVGVHEAPYWKKITLQAGLHGQLNLWTNAENYGNVLTLVREYVANERKNYD